jgi:hypothetical protein
VKDVPAARWFIAVERDPQRREALRRTREVRGPHGETQEVCYLWRLDEIEAEDLPQGTRTSVDSAFESAARRFAKAREEALRAQRERLAPPPRGGGSPIRIPLLESGCSAQQRSSWSR